KGEGRLDAQRASYNIYGRLGINTRDIDNEIDLGIAETPEQYPNINLAALKNSSETIYEPVIVIIGNSKKIKNALSDLADEVKVVDFKK
ncbi:MAG: hypothetical protein GY940_38305, partial [bacterium]|nr:hypothetical protein [bacterium]